MSAASALTNLSPSEEAELLALLEIERLSGARDSLAEFVRNIDIPGAPATEDEDEDQYYPVRVEPALHHRLLCLKLEEIERGELKRLIVLMPPGSAKSTYTSVVFPAWYLGKNPRRSIISTSYGSTLPKKFGRRCRSIVSSWEYQKIFNTTLRGDNAAVDNWSLDTGSEYMAAGILAGITGNRADGLLIDDPIKGREDADSPVMRDKTWEAYKSDLRTRLKPGGFIVLVLTRWHEDDPAGRILPEDFNGDTGWVKGRDGEWWYVLSLQAECEKEDDPLGREIGDFLWPEWFPREHFEAEKIAQGPRNWNALYQQRPAPDEGDFFKRDWFRWYEERPKHLRIYGASDFAVTADDGDYTVHIVAGVDPEDNLYILDLWRNRTASDLWIETMLDLAAVWKPISWAAEKGQIDRAVGPFLSKRMNERKVYVALEKFPTVTDKPTRAQSIRARAAQGKVYLPRNAPWVADLLTEMLTFPAGKHDDQVDAMAWMGRMLATMASAHVPPGQEKPRPRDYGFGRQSEEADWRTV